MATWNRTPPTEEQIEGYLERIAEGRSHIEAATEVGSTGSKFRGLRFRSEEFAQRYRDALLAAGNEEALSPLLKEIEGLEKLNLGRRLFEEYVLRAFDAERGSNGSSNRMLHNLSLLLESTFAPLLKARIKHVHEGAIGIYQLPQLDLDKWTLDEHEEWEALDQRRNELIEKARPDQISGSVHQKQLVEARIRKADEQGEIVDAEAVEIREP